MSAFARIPARFARLVKIEHTVFALPFAYVGALLAVDGVPSRARPALDHGRDGRRPLARDGAQPPDRRRDRRAQPAHREPRAAGRAALVARRSSLFCAASLAVFLVAVWQLDPLVRWLWPIPVAGFVIYPYLKRWTWLCHLWLGAVDGLAPVGGWVAITGTMPWEAWALGGAVALWVAGFDLFYSLFDLEIDRAQGLHSMATRFGERGRLPGAPALPRGDRRAARRRRRSASTSAPSTGSASPWSPGCSPYEHSLVRPGDLRRLDAAFFTMNGVICVAFLAFVLAGRARVIRARRAREALRRASACSTGLDFELPRGGFLRRHRAERLREDDAAAALRRPRARRPRGRSRSSRDRSRIGFLGHEPLVYRELTALENLDLYGRLYRVPERRERIGMLLERFGLWEARRERASTLSRGHAAAARALPRRSCTSPSC